MSIVSGAYGLGWGLFATIIATVGLIRGNPDVLFIFIIIPPVILGIIAIVGGYFALKRRRWPLALSAAIISIVIGLPFILGLLAHIEWTSAPGLGFFGVVIVMGILAVIFIARSKSEFA